MDKIICIGKNYLEHALELGDAVPEKPVIFLKPPSVLKQVNHWQDTLSLTFPESENTKSENNLHHECELVFRVNQDGYQMNSTDAAAALCDVTLGLDMTLRARQMQLKKKGHPWTTAKVFMDSAIIGPWISIKKFNDYMNTEFSLSIDGNLRQRGKANDMMMKPIDLLVYVSQFFPVCKGDLIFTGTPAGVGPIHKGSKATLNWENYYYNVVWE